MSEYTERVQNHPLHQMIGTLDNLLNSIESDGEPPSPDVVSATERLKQIRAHTQKTLSGVDPFLVSVTTLDNLHSLFQKLEGEIKHYQSNRNPAHLTTANNHADNVLVHLSSLLPVRGVGDLESLRRGITSFRRSVSQFHRYVDDEREGLAGPIQEARSSLQAVKNEIESQKGRLDTAISQFQGQFSQSEERRRAEHADEEKSRSEQSRTTLKESSEKLSKTAQIWEEKFKTLEDETREQTGAIAEKGKADLESVAKDLSDRVQGQMEKIGEYREQAQELVYVIANTGMVGGYQKIADQERKSSALWHRIAGGLFVGLIGFAIYAFLLTAESSFAWSAFAARIFVAAVFGLAVAYAARQADRHQDTERHSRRIELAIASVDPYLAGLPDQIREKVKSELAMKFFTAEEPKNPRKEAKVTGTSMDLGKLIRELINELKGST